MEKEKTVYKTRSFPLSKWVFTRKKSPRTPPVSPKKKVAIQDLSTSLTIERPSPRTWQKTSKSMGQLQVWKEIEEVDYEYDYLMQDRFYKMPIVLPDWIYPCKIRYIDYYHSVHSQLFELFDNNSHIYLVRWGGPLPTDWYSGKNKYTQPFGILWHEFVYNFERKRKKRVLIHPEEYKMRRFLKKLDYVILVSECKKYSIYKIFPTKNIKM